MCVSKTGTNHGLSGWVVTISRLRHFHRDLYLTSKIVMDVERLDILGNIAQNKATDPQ